LGLTDFGASVVGTGAVRPVNDRLYTGYTTHDHPYRLHTAPARAP